MNDSPDFVLYDSLKNNFDLTPFLTLTFIAYISVGILIAFMGAVTYHYIKEMYLSEKHELEIEGETT